MKEHLLEAFRWRCQYAHSEKNKGRAMGQITIGIRKKIAKEEEETKKSGIKKNTNKKYNVRKGNLENYNSIHITEKK